jgi:hypothetical protein
MSHVLATAAEIIGFAALAVTGVGAIVGATAFTAAVGVSASTIAGIAGLASAGLGLVASALQKKPPPVTNPMQWQADPLAGIPYLIGRTYYAGKIVYRNTWGGKDNPNETLISVYSAGPVTLFEGYYVDGVLTTISGTTANIPNSGRMSVSTQLGAQPEAAQLGALGPPNWTTASKLSGLAASSITLVYDAKGSETMTTEPQCGFVIHGATAYDPRLDSTYPGGSGPQRANDETTWTWSENPGLHALTWLIGRRQSGKLMMGVGVLMAAIIVSQFVELANVCDANGWKIGGVIDGRDDKWDRFGDILQAGGAEPLYLGAQIGCNVNTPKVSLATVTSADVIGDASVQATQARRDRINAIVPRFMGEQSIVTADPQHPDDSSKNITTVTWGMVAGGPVVVGDYVGLDGGQRQKQVDYTFVQGVSNGANAPNQVAQLARYDIENAREFGPITLPLKLRWMGYKPGDVITANIPELGLVNQDILIRQRSLSPQNATVTLTCRSETAAKHAFALGQTTTAPPTPSVGGVALVPVPGPSAWALVGGTITSASGTTIPVLQVTGAADSSTIDAVVFSYRTSQTGTASAGPWIGVTVQAPTIELLNITGVQDGAAYDVSVEYRIGVNTGDPLILGPATAGQTAVPWQTGVIGPGKPQDGATVGAPDGTPVGDRNAEVVTASLDTNAAAIISQGLRQDDAQTVLDARTLVSGQPVSTQFAAFQTAQTTTNTAVASSLALLGAKTGDGTAWDLNLDTVQIGGGTTLAEKFTEIGATTSALSGSVSTLESVVLNPDGTAKVSYTLTTSVVGSSGTKVVSGFTNSVDGTGSSTFDILAGHFSIVDPGDGTPHTVFDITGGVVTMHSVEVDTLKVGSVTMSSIAADQVTGLDPRSFADVEITSTETTIAEITGLVIGDAVDGKAVALVDLTQDGTSNVDTAMHLRAYVDVGSGYTLVKTRLSGIQVGGGDAHWSLPIAFTVPIFKGTTSLKITGQASEIDSAGHGNTNSSFARACEITIFSGAR